MRSLKLAALAAWGGLIVLCLLWELWLAPSSYAPAPVWTLIKLLPLAALAPALFGQGYRAYIYGCLLVLPYFSEGVMLAWSDPGMVRVLALTEILLVLVFVIPAALYVRRRREAEAGVTS
ncbi:MAG: hypothetical protein A2140_04070 [Candidatus Muproteobacteria bacterium RBG_16_62_13]|uniref:DUF2069 domain-containing protein n=1 Tax=Candidatus Muproteobacteria bacterium RBG_16_62_13 TaxID=1817756 RepID=A0A1F6T1K9_9PROT|nr:MAG: hypothetical protein A2140_04070 [Candidatus Muproteobacteria bacterium RBG_16_62_13]